jgi:hypothetical protein
MAPPEIADTLRLFDRKERHLVIQNCLGEGATKLCKTFRDDLAKALGSRLLPPILDNAWWATDYHLEWLAGALIWHREHGREDRERPRKDEDDLIRGNQEDIDLIIASGRDVILLEAKGHFSFANAPLASKIGRLTKLCHSETGIVPASDPANSIKLHLVLLSICKPTKVKHEQWPSWAKSNNGPYWMGLAASGNLMRVGRCDSEGHEGAEGGYWHMWQEPKLPPS